MCDEDGYTLMGKLSNLLMKKQPDFDPRNYGFSKLSKLVKALPRFEVDVRQGGQSNMKHFLSGTRSGNNKRAPPRRALFLDK